MHESFRVIAEDIGILHALHHLLEIVFFPFSEGVVEFYAVSLVLLVFGGQLEVLFIADGLEELRDVSLYLPLFRKQALFVLEQSFGFFLLVLDYKALVSHLCDAKLTQLGLASLDEVHDRAILDEVHHGSLVEDCGLLETQKEQRLVLLEVRIVSQHLQLMVKEVQQLLLLEFLLRAFTLVHSAREIILESPLYLSYDAHKHVHPYTFLHLSFLDLVPYYH